MCWGSVWDRSGIGVGLAIFTGDELAFGATLCEKYQLSIARHI